MKKWILNTFHLSDPPEGTNLTTSAASNTAVEGDQVTFTCRVTGTKPAVDKYKLYFKNTPIAENSKGTYQINSVKRSNQGTYKCVPHNAAGDGEEATVTLTVNGKLWIKCYSYLKNKKKCSSSLECNLPFYVRTAYYRHVGIWILAKCITWHLTLHIHLTVAY